MTICHRSTLTPTRVSFLLRVPLPAVSVGASGLYPDDPGIRDALTFETKFGDLYELFRTTGDGRIEVPRNMTTWGPKTVDRMVDGLDQAIASSFEPRNNEQRIMAEGIISLLQQGESFIFQAPTGFGKTVCVCHAIAAIGKKTIVTVHKEDLVEQWEKAFRDILCLKRSEIGLIRGDTVKVRGYPVVIAMVQSMGKEYRYPADTFDGFGLAVWDECHRVSADMFINSAFRVPAKLRLGMSATPDRLDGKEVVFEAHVGQVMVSTEAAALVPKVIMVRTHWNVPRVRDPDTGEFRQLWHEPTQDMHVIKALAYNTQRNKIITGFVYNCYRKGRKIIVFSVLKKHLQLIKEMLSQGGVPKDDVATYVGGMSATARAKAKTKPILLSTFKFTAEGTDIPDLDTAVLGTPVANVEQPIGRILREVEGKQNPVVLDLVDDDSELYRRYAMKRQRWYEAKGSEIVQR